MPITLRHARRIGDHLLEILAPACLESPAPMIVGSVRREKPYVKDVELLAIPRIEERPAPQASLFSAANQQPQTVSLVWERLEALREEGRLVPVKPGGRETNGVMPEDRKWREKRNGSSRYLRLYLPQPQVLVDLFLACPETWGLDCVIRTGAAEFSAAVLTRWKATSGGGESRGCRLWRPGEDEPIETPQEAEVFEAIGCRWVEPQDRHGAGALRPLPS